MARVTVEDCMNTVDSTYELVLAVSMRARDLLDGKPTMLEDVSRREKPTVTALREIADGMVDRFGQTVGQSVEQADDQIVAQTADQAVAEDDAENDALPAAEVTNPSVEADASDLST